MEKTFTITITGTKHGEWQGRVCSAGEMENRFQSVIELLKILNNKLEEPHE